jgi:hypothetical protein
VCNGLGYYETWKHDYGSHVRKHKCPCKIPNYIYPDCPVLGIKGGDPMTLWGIAPDLEDEDNLVYTHPVAGINCDINGEPFSVQNASLSHGDESAESPTKQ